MRASLLSFLLLAAPVTALSAPPPEPTGKARLDSSAERIGALGGREAQIRLANQETVVFFGDSITEQNLYSAFLETFLLSRFPEKQITSFNFGWGGDTASGGNKRFARDVLPVKPTLVFVNFGMNDGGYKAYDESTYRKYLEAQTALAETILGSGARQVLLTSSPVDHVLRRDDGVYNETLSRLARGVVGLAAKRQVPVIDLFHPMLEVQRLAKEKDPAFTMIPDTIHPNPVGHLVMAYLALRQIDAPRSVGEITVNGEDVSASLGASVSNVKAKDGSVEFDLELPFLPFYVPQEARQALELVPFQEEQNRFRLLVRSEGVGSTVLSVDGKTAGVFEAEGLAQGIDLALLDKAPWAEAGRLLWQAAQFRFEKHFESWRQMGFSKPAFMMPSLPGFEGYARAERAYADEMGRSLATLVQPRTYRVSLRPLGAPVPIASVLLSPTYPLERFDAAHPPEKDPAGVAWTSAPLTSGTIDLGARFAGATSVVAYARVVLEADQETTLHLALGSDDGLAVFHQGRVVLARDVARSLRPGEDEVELSLVPGRNELLFKVTQGGGDFGLAVEARVRGKGKVREVEVR